MYLLIRLGGKNTNSFKTDILILIFIEPHESQIDFVETFTRNTNISWKFSNKPKQWMTQYLNQKLLVSEALKIKARYTLTQLKLRL